MSSPEPKATPAAALAELRATRRAVLKGLAALAAAGALPRALAAAAPSAFTGFSDAQRVTLAAVYDVLWPDDGDGPSARELGVVGFLGRELGAPHADPDERRFVVNGIGWLEELAIDRHGRPFTLLTPVDGALLIERVSGSSAGERWLSLLVNRLLEALLADPVYGVNPDGAGWRWLAHTPGFPRPDPAHTWDRIGYGAGG